MKSFRLTSRTRILGLTTLIVAIALGVTILLLRQILLSDLDSRIDNSLTQEADELAETTARANRVDDQSSEEFALAVLETYLITNVPAQDEVLIAAQHGVPLLESREPPGDIKPLLGDLLGVLEPTTERLNVEGGEVRVLAQPIVDEGRQVGVLIIGFFTAGERARIDETTRDAGVVALAALAVAVALAWIVAGRVLRPIRTLADTAREITEQDLSRRIEPVGSDEITAMVVNFNAMLDRLEAGAATQRRFLDDASHELRTPLTIMRGHLEMQLSDPTSAATSTPIVMREVDRMARIVDDLLMLARADSMDFMKPAPVDTDDFIEKIYELVQKLGDHRWTIDEVPVGVIVADEDGLTQAMLNLAANASRHTGIGAEIRIGGRLQGDRFSIWVSDDGDGIDPTEQERIFERFHRADTQRSRGGSAGLGLPIVTAIATAHGGKVSLKSEVGVGSTFTITIPASPFRSGAGQIAQQSNGSTRPEEP